MTMEVVVIASAWRGFLLLFGCLLAVCSTAVAAVVRNHFANFRSFEGHWERGKASYLPAFVEFVEEQRSKAAVVPSTR